MSETSASSVPTIAETALPLSILRRGKVRDVYDVDANTVLLIATDRVSAFDIVMREPVPWKGIVLNQITAWWLQQLSNPASSSSSSRPPAIKHHMITTDSQEMIRRIPSLAPYRKDLIGRAMLAVRTEVFPIECVVRGYLSGSGWKEYQAQGTLADEALPSGLMESAKLSHPMFTPATKAESGHDENISRAQAGEQLGPVATRLEQLSLELYAWGSETAAKHGIIVADTKFEFGTRTGDGDGEVILVDEVMTPDSSRFWATDTYRPGTTPPSFDKQPLRDYLDRERRDGNWTGEAPAPALPASVIEAMTARYLEAYRRITGRPLDTAALLQDISGSRS